MASVNRVILLGNLTRDPQLRYLPSQTPVVEFGMAMNRRFRTQSGEQRDETTFVDCTAFGRTAEIINQYVRKGNMLFVEGRLRYEQWEDKQGGGKRSKLSVFVENVQLMPRGAAAGGAPDAAAGGDTHGGDQPAPAAARTAASHNSSPEPPFPQEDSFREDDIPF